MTKRPRYSQEFKDAIVALYQEGRSSLSLSIDTVWPPLPLLNGFMAAKNK